MLPVFFQLKNNIEINTDNMILLFTDLKIPITENKTNEQLKYFSTHSKIIESKMNRDKLRSIGFSVFTYDLSEYLK